MKFNVRRFKKKKIVVAMGGISAERSISLLTGRAVFESLRRQGFSAECLDLTPAAIPALIRKKPDFVFIALHGTWGEDGRVQALLDLARIPYSGCGMLASAACMDKVFTKKIFSFHRIPTPRFFVVKKRDLINGKPAGFKLKIPLVVKPACQGSAIGVSVVKNDRAFSAAVAKALRFSAEALVERYIKGTEITVGILGNKALPVIEIVPRNSFYDFESKYKPRMSRHIIPARLPARVLRKVQSIALRAFESLGCSVYGRVDLIVDERMRPFVLEINTIPGMTATSLLPDACRAAAIDFDALVCEIIKLSMEK